MQPRTPAGVEGAAPFTALARVYDRIMADIEYGEWAEFVLAKAEELGFAGGPVLDLGCGTGNATRPLVERGLLVEGLDASPAMLKVARAKLPGVTFHQGEFETFSLGQRYALVYSVFDSLNNLLTDEAFGAMASNVLGHLLPGGVFVFDVNTTAGLRQLWEGGVASGWADDVYYRWEHSFDEARQLAKVEAYCDTAEGAFTEVHYERGYDADLVQRLLARAGFRGVQVLAHPDGGRVDSDTDRLWVAAKR
ncbi:MAG: methyltransferase domain-containing protein [Trueperaceae bacterium]